MSCGSIPAWAGEPRGIIGDDLLPEVYPRVGGGAASVADTNTSAYGLSPRGRGSHLRYPRRGGAVRSIPAWAGEPVSGRPRGERPEGLSPRGRGSRNPTFSFGTVVRSIPAWAGEPPGPRDLHCGLWVYPRVGGGAEAKHDGN